MRYGSNIDPPNRFEAVHRELDFEHVEWDQEYLDSSIRRQVEYIADASRSVISENNSPDVPFRYSLNPYRGCQHGCAYCYARNTHEYLGYNAGLDFETKIIVKYEAPLLFREFLSRPSWQPQEIAFSGVTDCYQPAEREFQLTRGCLEVALEYRQPIGIVTKNALVVRDLDLLSDLAAQRLVHVNISVTTLDAELARTMEPRTSTPAARLRAIEMLSQRGIPTRIMVAPVIPGLNDPEIPAILSAGKEAGATAAAYILLRLPLTVEPVFREWLERTEPLKAQKIESLIRDTRSGYLNRSEWGARMTGTGNIAEHVKNVFQIFSRKLGLHEALPDYDVSRFHPPTPRGGQLRLF
ncbi:MAG: PA0069 family radical SAM protein [Planctomycetota bacterium]|nr:PA0069 family radical SAM protein [Planctomycetota bacterium]MDA1212463.1 PA0069 family radical SAM protein [Planctomycetota bacterium]